MTAMTEAAKAGNHGAFGGGGGGGALVVIDSSGTATGFTGNFAGGASTGSGSLCPAGSAGGNGAAYSLAAATVTSTNPASESPGATSQNITVNGSGFASGAVASFSNPG